MLKIMNYDNYFEDRILQLFKVCCTFYYKYVLAERNDIDINEIEKKDSTSNQKKTSRERNA
jgi:hypothetical protein